MESYWIDVFIILALIFFNGLLAMTEMAMVSANRNKMDVMSKNHLGAKAALQLIQNPGQFLSTIQIGITIISIVSGVFSGQRFAEPLGDWLNEFHWIYGQGNWIAFSAVVLIITYVSLVLGELIPKRVALSKPEHVASFFAKPIQILSQIAYPFVVVLDFSTKSILHLFGHQLVRDQSLTEEEIHSVIQQGLKEGTIDDFEHQVFQRVLKFGDRQVSIMMTPSIKVVCLDLQDSVEENQRKIADSPHRYYPVFDGGAENFKGIVDTKDMISQHLQGKPFELQPLIKPAPCVIEDNLGPELLNEFKKHKTHIAIVVDEYGSMEGIVTLVDLFETLVGDIQKSNQEKHYHIVHRPDHSWLCDGLTPIDDIEELLAIGVVDAFDDNVFNTLAGFLLAHFKHIPAEGECVEWKGFRFEIMDMDGTRIDKVLIQKIS